MAFIVGIDEAGRGPLAGPVALGAVRIDSDFDLGLLKNARDSKQLSAKSREVWYARIQEAQEAGLLDYAVSLVSEGTIDKQGINYAINLGIKRCLDKLKAGESDQIYLDGGIKAPPGFTHQQTIIKGDQKVPVISLASIVVKVVRDRRMVKLAKKYPEFGLEKHKGYGTLAHRQAIRKHGPRAVHRKSFLRSLT